MGKRMIPGDVKEPLTLHIPRYVIAKLMDEDEHRNPAEAAKKIIYEYLEKNEK